jgi:hypothetical protein
VAVSSKGEVFAAESQGRIVIAGRTVASSAGHFGLVAEDGRDLRSSRKLRALPHHTRVRLHVLRSPVPGRSPRYGLSRSKLPNAAGGLNAWQLPSTSARQSSRYPRRPAE